MFVKVYEYHIHKEKIEEYLNIQEKTGEIYGKFLGCHTMYLQSNDDATKWMEITRYKSEEEYNKSIEIINQHKEIQELFTSFQNVLLHKKSQVSEGNFTEVKEIGSL